MMKHGSKKKSSTKRNITPKKKLDTPPAPVVECAETEATAAIQPPAKQQETPVMTFTLRGLSKNGTAAFYTGAKLPLRLSLANFPNRTPPQTFEVSDGAFLTQAQPKPKMTAEERKAARAAKPKPTLAEKVAAAEQRAAKLREQLAAAASAQPSM